MLFVCSDICKFNEFKELFRKQTEGIPFHDLSISPPELLASQCVSIQNHYDKSAVFLGYLEPGWMIEPTKQIFLRYLIRTYPVGLVCNYTESLPHSWKNGIHTIYTSGASIKNGVSGSVNNGSSVQDKSDI